jgi:hypothetical protein
LWRLNQFSNSRGTNSSHFELDLAIAIQVPNLAGILTATSQRRLFASHPPDAVRKAVQTPGLSAEMKKTSNGIIEN